MHYRLYALDARTGSIVAGDDLVAPDDDAAMAQSALVYAAPDAAYELWCGARRVLRCMMSDPSVTLPSQIADGPFK